MPTRRLTRWLHRYARRATADDASRRALFADESVRQIVAAAGDGFPVVGLKPDARPLILDLDGQDKHVTVCAYGGDEAATILRSLTAQVLHHGAQATIFNCTRESQRWARGLAGVEHLSDVADIHAWLRGLTEATDRREGNAESGQRRHLLVIEDSHETAAEALWWNSERSFPELPPGIRAFNDLIVSGGGARVNILLTVCGGPKPIVPGAHSLIRERDALDRLTPILVRALPPAWANLAPDAGPAPRASWRYPDRIHLVREGGAIEAQAIRMTEDEARAWAQARR